ncbi:MAG: hypothetical protein DDT37_00504 [Firmicutes bacterium]|nr:hypothetical protein [candidate division NPL-UPA2 bacterium]MBT9155537.1 hypothetical protein [candidate division NPL-UPA2 bacterium]
MTTAHDLVKIKVDITNIKGLVRIHEHVRNQKPQEDFRL